MAACPKCKTGITDLSLMELCDIFHGDREVMEHYYCCCPSCDHTFYLDIYYKYDRDEIVEGSVCGSN